MIQTATTLVITVGSAALFVYWFRYTSLLILSAKTTRDFAGEIAQAHQLSFLEVQAKLRATDRTPAGVNLDTLQSALDRDYERIQKLIQDGFSNEAETRLEDRMLQVNYRLAHTWFKLVKNVAPDAAAQALDEMSMVVAHFANSFGERASQASAA